MDKAAMITSGRLGTVGDDLMSRRSAE